MSLALNQHVEPMNVNDKEIFLAIRKHPEEEFRKLMAAYMQPVYWHIRRMVSVHADAEDATQETFVRIYRSIGQHSETGSLRAWIFRIATNEALRLLGRRAGKVTLSLDDASAEVLAIKQDEWFDSSDKLSARRSKPSPTALSAARRFSPCGRNTTSATAPSLRRSKYSASMKWSAR